MKNPLIRPTSPSPAFGTRDIGRDISSANIDAHMAAFLKAGGKVEVLGNTPIHKPWRAAGAAASATAKPSR